MLIACYYMRDKRKTHPLIKNKVFEITNLTQILFTECVKNKNN